jgi:putative membrane protein
LRWLINALALFAAATVVPGIEVDGNGWVIYAVVAIIFGLVNALIRPLLKLMTCPLILLTLGLFTLVINALMLWLTSWLSQALDLGFYVDGFWPAFWGGLVAGIVSVILNLIVKDDDEDKRKRRRERW